MIRRLVSIDFWTDDKVVDKFSPEDKYFMLYLLTNPHTTQLGIYKLNIKYAAFETGYSTDTINSLLDRFENHLGIIYYSKDTGEIAIKNYLIHSIIKGGKPVADLLWKEINDVKNKDLIDKVFSHIKDSDKINKTVKNIIENYYEALKKEKRTKKEKNHNENENENDKSYPLSCNESFDESFDESCKHKYGQYSLVLLTNSEYKLLCTEYGEEMTKKMIKKLDEYIKMKDYKAESHYLCMKKWVYGAVMKDEYKANKASSKKNQFNSFPQRNRSPEDMEQLEKILLTTSVPEGEYHG